ncbi:hypothetical protein K2Q16_04385 [Patescibacteria group bacterium]|nr:hypothetical protein [Patescibacteria group bacterium]
MAYVAEGGEGVRLVIRCSDERSEPLHPTPAPTISVPGGILDPLCPCSSGVSVETRQSIFIGKIKLLITARKPVSIEIVTHEHCAVQALIGFTEAEVQRYVEAFIARLRAAGVHLPIVVMHDHHCIKGLTRLHRLRLRCDPAIAA